mmetsp:Transcript_16558/g.23527  ORF Transcript_16558/g.23527 Transcript_16558/m.23527 type:complete len:257 (+) Transcript_16558:176-946(+)
MFSSQFILFICLFPAWISLKFCSSFQTSSTVKHTISKHHLDERSLLKSSVVNEVSSLNEDISQTTRDLPPVLQNIVDERKEFEINLGRAMDQLRKDYPHMLYQTPEFSIYHEDISVVDPSGVQLSGIGNYKTSFSFLQTLVRFFYNTNESGVQHRMVYDFARQSIRISWNAVLVPKVVGNRRNALYVDGISIYKMDTESGKIVEHKVENMLINNIPVTPPYGVLTALRDELLHPAHHRIPVGAGYGAIIDSVNIFQ